MLWLANGRGLTGRTSRKARQQQQQASERASKQASKHGKMEEVARERDGTRCRQIGRPEGLAQVYVRPSTGACVSGFVTETGPAFSFAPTARARRIVRLRP